MEFIVPKFKKNIISLKLIALTFILFGFGVLSIVWWLQYGLGYQPCHLCYWQRYPWWSLGLLGCLGFVLSKKFLQKHIHFNLVFLFLALGILLMLISAGLALFHVGVEQHWWRGLASCQASSTEIGTEIDFFNNPIIIPCDKAMLVWLGFSLSMWNFLGSLTLASIGIVIGYKMMFKKKEIIEFFIKLF